MSEAATNQNQPLKASIMECMSNSNQFQNLRQLVKHQEELAKMKTDGFQTNIES